MEVGSIISSEGAQDQKNKCIFSLICGSYLFLGGVVLHFDELFLLEFALQ